MNNSVLKTKLQNIAIASGIAIFFIADRRLKASALNLDYGAYFKLLGDEFVFRFTPNYFIAFSLPFGGIWLNITLILIIIGLSYSIFYLILNKKAFELDHFKRKLSIILLTVILFGAISNILDRLIYGYVIDYLDLRNFTIFNLADIMISIGTLTLISCYLKKK